VWLNTETILYSATIMGAITVRFLALKMSLAFKARETEIQTSQIQQETEFREE
jgi:hypothetical protein